MLVDNDKINGKLHEKFDLNDTNFISKIVTGYFTLRALKYLIDKTEGKITNYNFIIGDYRLATKDQNNFLDLMNNGNTPEDAIDQNKLSKDIIKYLEKDSVQIKTLEPNFCHAKSYIFQHKDKTKSTYSIGSSNLTEAGIGLKKNNNFELNVWGQGSADEYTELLKWFDNLWDHEKAKLDIKKNGRTINFKNYLIEEIKKLFKKYTPEEIYFKILYQLWGDKLSADMLDPDFNKQIGKLETTQLYIDLKEFQRNGVKSLIKMLNDHNGAIMADAVGLGKTWSALAVIKYYEFMGYKTILLCPKKLERNWEKFLRPDSKFRDTKFEYTMRFHTDLNDRLWNKYQGKDALPLEFMNDDKPKLIVIDESHNLRNDKSTRYKWFMENILTKTKGDIKILLLTATPINNTLNDIRNQFKLIAKNDNGAFSEKLEVNSLDYTFEQANKIFKEWSLMENRNISSFVNMINDSNFFKLTDSLIVARTRSMINDDTSLKFPKKLKPKNIRISEVKIGDFNSFESIFNALPPKLSGYQPSAYLKLIEKKEAIYDERQRDFFLAKMMYILLIKRLESSWFSFLKTVDKILVHHSNALNSILDYEKSKKIKNQLNESEHEFEQNDEMFDEDDDLENQFETLTLGKKRKIKIAEIDEAGKLEEFKIDLAKDIEDLEYLKTNLKGFENKLLNNNTKDKKVEELVKLIDDKRKQKSNNGNQKILIFTAFKDTAEYLYQQLRKKGYDKIACMSGTNHISSYIETENKDFKYKSSVNKFDDILEQFAPYGKMYNDKKWNGFNPTEAKDYIKSFEEWKDWIKNENKDKDLDSFIKLTNPIDILIATDCLSEGQNLQDCDYVVNYDIHWNPVRILQRCGRIDRLQSPNDIIYSANFWPTDNINKYLKLEKRIEDRMIAMALAGSEVDKNFTESLKKKISDDELERKQKDKMLNKLETSFDEADFEVDTLGANNLSLDIFRQDLIQFILNTKEKLKNMPNGVYSGFAVNDTELEPGIIALFGRPSKKNTENEHTYKYYDLVYIDYNGNNIKNNQSEILSILMKYKKNERDDYGLTLIDQNDTKAINKLKNAMNSCFNRFSNSTENTDNENNNSNGQNALDFLYNLGKGNSKALEEAKELNTMDEKFSKEYNDLITWLIINKGE